MKLLENDFQSQTPTTLFPFSTGVNTRTRASLDSTRTSLTSPSTDRGPQMVMLPLRQVRLPKAAEQYFDGWLADLDAQLSESGADWHRITRELLYQIYYPGSTDYDGMLQDPAT